MLPTIIWELMANVNFMLKAYSKINQLKTICITQRYPGPVCLLELWLLKEKKQISVRPQRSRLSPVIWLCRRSSAVGTSWPKNWFDIPNVISKISRIYVIILGWLFLLFRLRNSLPQVFNKNKRNIIEYWCIIQHSTFHLPKAGWTPPNSHNTSQHHLLQPDWVKQVHHRHLSIINKARPN